MPFLDTYARYPVTIVQGEGVRLRDDQGRWYLDAFAGIGVMALGHGHPEVMAAVHAQVDRVMHTSNSVFNDAQNAFVERLSAAFDGASVFLANSGTEATDGAVKLVRKHHWRLGEARDEIVVLRDAFHGRTYMGLAMTDAPDLKEGMGPWPGPVVFAEHAEAADVVSERTAAVFVEPVQGRSGCFPVTVLPELRAACDRTGALLVYDEIQCGLGRTGQFTHAPHADVVTLAKALGGGLPLGAVVARPHVAAAFKKGDHGTTFGGNPVACAAGSATLDVILRDDLPGQCLRMGARLRQGLEATGATVTGAGLMLAAKVGRPPGPVVARLRELGVLATTGGDAVRLLPAFIIDEGHVDEILEAWRGL